MLRRQTSATDIGSGRDHGGYKRNSDDLMPPPVKIPSIRRRQAAQIISSPSFREQVNEQSF